MIPLLAIKASFFTHHTVKWSLDKGRIGFGYKLLKDSDDQRHYNIKVDEILLFVLPMAFNRGRIPPMRQIVNVLGEKNEASWMSKCASAICKKSISPPINILPFIFVQETKTKGKK